jgi:hypothetical protein
VGEKNQKKKSVFYVVLSAIILLVIVWLVIDAISETDEYKAIRLFNYKSDNLLEAIKQCKDSFIVIDNADILMNDVFKSIYAFLKKL